jgi:hypothetical protein
VDIEIALLLSIILVYVATSGVRAQGVPPRAEILQELAHARSAPLRDVIPHVDHRPNASTPVVPLHKPGHQRRRRQLEPVRGLIPICRSAAPAQRRRPRF